MALITLLTDFGHQDTFVGVVKGVMLGLCPAARIVDLCHDVPRHDVAAAGFMLSQALPYFPPDTIHVAVVDPGVGGKRSAVAVRVRRQILIGPDNGLFTLAVANNPSAEIIHLDQPAFHLEHVSATFHGRDIFAPVAAHLARGVPFSAVGSPATSLVRLELPEVTVTADRLEGCIVRADVFGNLVCNISAHQLQRWLGAHETSLMEVVVGPHLIRGLMRTYEDVDPGAWLAYLGSDGFLELAIREGNAGREVAPGTQVTLRRTR